MCRGLRLCTYYLTLSVMRLPFFLASRFVAGESFEQAVTVVREFNNAGIAVTLDMLGENVSDRAMADATAHSYRQLLSDIATEQLQASISIKLTMLGLDIHKECCRENLFALLDRARECNRFVRIDMEASRYVDDTLELFYEARAEYGDLVGPVIQASLHRSREDVARLAREQIDVRLCKGAYREPAEVALQKMPMIRAVFKEYAQTLMTSAPLTRIATHDDMLIDWVCSFAREHEIDQKRFEFQMLYGLRLDTCRELVQQGYQVRIYVPYGTMWLPYFTRRLRERKENVWFVLSNLFRK